MLSAPSEKLLIIDGHAYAYRAFHAIRQLNSPSGAPTNAIYGFIKMLGKMRSQLNPTHLVVVWDGGLCPQRMEEHPEYKTQRPPMPGDLELQLSSIFAFLQASGIASFCQENVEADDWIAALARGLAEQMPVLIASSDKDFMQLVSPAVGLINPNDKTERVWRSEEVKSKTGVDPGQIVDWLSLIGDSVDNIPGIPGIGPKTATDLLQQFGSIDGLYSRLGELKTDRLRAVLESGAEVVRRNQRLIRLKEDQPCASAGDLVLRPPHVERLRELFAEWGFKTLLAQLNETAATQGKLL